MALSSNSGLDVWHEIQCKVFSPGSLHWRCWDSDLVSIDLPTRCWLNQSAWQQWLHLHPPPSAHDFRSAILIIGLGHQLSLTNRGIAVNEGYNIYATSFCHTHYHRISIWKYICICIYFYIYILFFIIYPINFFNTQMARWIGPPGLCMDSGSTHGSVSYLKQQ